MSHINLLGKGRVREGQGERAGYAEGIEEGKTPGEIGDEREGEARWHLRGVHWREDMLSKAENIELRGDSPGHADTWGTGRKGHPLATIRDQAMLGCVW